MDIYVDVLVFINAVIDYYLLRLTSLFLKERPHRIRLIIGSIVAGFMSLYILVPKFNAFVEFAVSAVFCLLIVMVTFGRKKANRLCKLSTCYFLISFVFGGFMFAVANLISQSGLAVRNNVLYVDISPVEMLIFTSAAYIIVNVFHFVISKTNIKSTRYTILLKRKNKSVQMLALADTGNSLTDIYSNSVVVLVDKQTALLLIDDYNSERTLLLPYETIGGSSFLKAFRCDSLEVNSTVIEKPLVAVANVNFDDDYKAIINPNDLH